MAKNYPILLDVADRPIAIIGGGKVAARKAHGLLAAGATQIRCVSPVFRDDFPDAVQRIVDRYHSQHLVGVQLVFAATDSRDVNEAIVRDARQAGILVSRADNDDADPGDFLTPARLEQGPVIVAVSAGSAALSAMIRDDLEAKLDRRFVDMAGAMRTLRPEIRASKLDGDARARVFRELTTDVAMQVLQEQGIDGLRGWLLARFPELNHG